MRGCEETRGRKNWSDEVRQSVYIWIEHSAIVLMTEMAETQLK